MNNNNKLIWYADYNMASDFLVSAIFVSKNRKRTGCPSKNNFLLVKTQPWHVRSLSHFLRVPHVLSPGHSRYFYFLVSHSNFKLNACMETYRIPYALVTKGKKSGFACNGWGSPNNYHITLIVCLCMWDSIRPWPYFCWLDQYSAAGAPLKNSVMAGQGSTTADYKLQTFCFCLSFIARIMAGILP